MNLAFSKQTVYKADYQLLTHCQRVKTPKPCSPEIYLMQLMIIRL